MPALKDERITSRMLRFQCWLSSYRYIIHARITHASCCLQVYHAHAVLLTFCRPRAQTSSCTADEHIEAICIHTMRYATTQYARQERGC